MGHVTRQIVSLNQPQFLLLTSPNKKRKKLQTDIRTHNLYKYVNYMTFALKENTFFCLLITCAKA